MDVFCKTKVEEKTKLVKLSFRAPDNYTKLSLTEAINAIDRSLNIDYIIYDLVEYDTLKEINDKKLDNPFKLNIERGFSVEYLNSYVINFEVYNGKAQFYVFSTAKLTNPYYTEYYCYNPKIVTEVGEGSSSYIENLATGNISSSKFQMKNEIVERMLYEADNEITTFGKNTAITDDMIDRYDQDINILKKPSSLKYNESTNILTWNSFGLAKGYIISVNGTEYTSTENSFVIPTVSDEMTIKVKSYNDLYESEWSDELSYVKSA